MADNLPFHDDPHAPEIFASGASGVFHLGGSVVVTLEAIKSDYATNPGTLARHVVGRLILTPQCAHNLAVGLFDFLKSQGLLPESDAPVQ